jgi:hypothetical protein
MAVCDDASSDSKKIVATNLCNVLFDTIHPRESFQSSPTEPRRGWGAQQALHAAKT